VDALLYEEADFARNCMVVVICLVLDITTPANRMSSIINTCKKTREKLTADAIESQNARMFWRA
jgi:hypothetical protein